MMFYASKGPIVLKTNCVLFVCCVVILYIFIPGISQVVGTKQAFASKWIFTFVTVLQFRVQDCVAGLATCYGVDGPVVEFW